MGGFLSFVSKPKKCSVKSNSVANSDPMKTQDWGIAFDVIGL